jgi:2-polyprenyl-6-methoxyphenol hydroxylase-like FAD-dependent oxidoreductase
VGRVFLGFLRPASRPLFQRRLDVGQSPFVRRTRCHGWPGVVQGRRLGRPPPRRESYPEGEAGRAWRAGTRFDDARVRDRFVEVWGVGGGFGFGPAGSDRVYWYCFETVPEGAPAPDRPRDEFLRRYGAWFDPIPALIEATDPDALEPTFTYDRRPRRDWGRGRVTLLGDAAHPMKPNIGQGAAQALEDAVVLGDCLAANRDPEDALRTYERRRVRRATAVARASRRAGRAAEIRSPLVARLRDAVMKALPDRLTVAQQRNIAEFRP